MKFYQPVLFAGLGSTGGSPDRYWTALAAGHTGFVDPPLDHCHAEAVAHGISDVGFRTV